MSLKDTPIQRKLMAMVLLTSGAVLLLTCTAFFAYEYLTFRQVAVEQLATLGEIIADNSTAALAFRNSDDAKQILAALKADRHIVAASLYDAENNRFASYPDTLPADAFPSAPPRDGYRFERAHLTAIHAVVEGNRRLGSLYIKFDMGAVYERFRLYGGIVISVMGASLLLAYALSRTLQKQISRPILALAEAARAVSDRKDYSVRASKVGEDEVGRLTDAFNQMLTQIQEQTHALNQMAAIVESSYDAIIGKDLGGIITSWNPGAEKLFRYAAHEAIGQSMRMLIPPDRENEEPKILARIAGGESIDRFETVRVGKDGRRIDVSETISPIRDRQGQIVGTSNISRDITEGKQAEAKLQAQLSRLNLLSRVTRAIGERQDLPSMFQVLIRNLEESLPIDFGCVCLYDSAEEVLTVTSVGARSEALAASLALTSDARIPIDRNGLARCVRGQLVYEPDLAEVAFPFPRRLAGGGLRAMVAAPLLVESKVFGVLVAARRQPDSFGSPDCEFLRQLSEHAALAAHQAQLYGALQEAYNELRQTQQTILQQERLRALGQMASGIAHDINNAISPMSLYTESLLEQEPNLSPRARDYLATIQRAIDDVAQTVSRMREFYRQREPQLTLGPVELDRIVRQVIDLTRARWSDIPQERGIVIRMETDFAPDLPRLMGIEGEIRDALTNLVLNAVDAMPEGGVLTLRTRRVPDKAADKGLDAAATRVSVEVVDTGVGMDEDTRRRCLEPFFTTKGERGTGLGLAMVYGMVQRHSAEIEIESKPGEGTTVRLTLPLSAVVSAPALHSSKVARPTDGLRILIVDDDPLLLKSLRDTLETDGHRVCAADSGRAGIDAFEAGRVRGEPFRVVITDLGMPYVDGRKVAASVKRAAPATPVILLTGWGQRLVAEGDIPPNVDRVLNKPPKLLELRSTLAELVGEAAQTEVP